MTSPPSIVAAVSLSSWGYYVVLRWVFDAAVYPASAYLLDSLLLIAFMGGIRLVRSAPGLAPGARKARSYGAGDAGEMIVRDMRQNRLCQLRADGLHRRRPGHGGPPRHGVKVLGTRAALPKIMAGQKPDAVVVAIPRARPSGDPRDRPRARALHGADPTLPSLPTCIDGRVTVSQIRTLAVEDLAQYARAPLGSTSSQSAT